MAVTTRRRQKASAIGTELCPDGIKVGSSQGQYCRSGEIIVGVCIKSGNKVYSFDQDMNDGCYDVKGIGTECVNVTGGGTGRDCKEISGITLYVEKK